MIYLYGVGGVFLLQAAVSGAVILASTGGGSFAGLGAMLLAVYGLPGTAIANFAILRKHRKEPDKPFGLRIGLVSSILPILQLSLLVAVEVFRL